MIKGVPIALYEVQRGDVVMAEAGRACKVKELPREVSTGEACMEYELPGIVTGSQNRIVGLIHRPWPEGKTEEDMINDVLVAMISTGATRSREDFKQKLPALREAIEAWELSKPLEPDKE